MTKENYSIQVGDLLDTLTVKEVAELLCIHENTVYNWIHSGRLPAFKSADNPYTVARHWRIRRKDLLCLIEKLDA